MNDEEHHRPLYNDGQLVKEPAVSGSVRSRATKMADPDEKLPAGGT